MAVHQYTRYKLLNLLGHIAVAVCCFLGPVLWKALRLMIAPLFVLDLLSAVDALSQRKSDLEGGNKRISRGKRRRPRNQPVSENGNIHLYEKRTHLRFLRSIGMTMLIDCIAVASLGMSAFSFAVVLVLC